MTMMNSEQAAQMSSTLQARVDRDNTSANSHCRLSTGPTRDRAIARILRRARRDEVTEAMDELDYAKVRRLELKKELESLESEISKLQDFILENAKGDSQSPDQKTYE